MLISVDSNFLKVMAMKFVALYGHKHELTIDGIAEENILTLIDDNNRINMVRVLSLSGNDGWYGVYMHVKTSKDDPNDCKLTMRFDDNPESVLEGMTYASVNTMYKIYEESGFNDKGIIIGGKLKHGGIEYITIGDKDGIPQKNIQNKSDQL